MANLPARMTAEHFLPHDKTDRDWMRLAACRDTGDADAFFPDTSGGRDRRITKLVNTHCRECPVLLRCAQYAADHQVTAGIWGGVDLGRRDGRHNLAALIRRKPSCSQ